MLQSLKRSKSLIVIRNLVVAEVVVYVVFLVVALSAYWAEIYRTFAISRYLSFTVLEFTGLAAFQIILIVIVVIKSIQEEADIEEIIRSGEHERLEFKTSLRWDTQRGQVNKDLERSVMKTVAAFLNSDGGSLVIGLDDQKQVVGLEPDLASLVRKNHDGFENHFNNLFVSMIGPEFRQFVKLSFHDINNKSVSLIQVDRAQRPAYVKTGNGEDFFIRTGNATTSLKVSQVASYVSSSWPK